MFYMNCIAHEKSLGFTECVPRILQEGKKKKFVCVFIIKKGVLTFPTHNGWQLSRLFMSIDFTVTAAIHG